MGRRRWTYTGLQSNVVGTLFVSVIFQALKGRTGVSIRIFLSVHVMCVLPLKNAEITRLPLLSLVEAKRYQLL